MPDVLVPLDDIGKYFGGSSLTFRNDLKIVHTPKCGPVVTSLSNEKL